MFQPILKVRPGRMLEKNKLYFGDNLDILRDKISDNSIDLIYLDPPFQSGRNYNQIFRPEEGGIRGATAQAQAFEDTWEWGEEAEKNYGGLITGAINKEKPSQKLVDLIKAMRGYLGEKVPMMAYLSMMAPRLLEMRRVLKETGSIYLHCDPTASHYLKLLMDAIFGVNSFKNEIIWHYTGGGRSKNFFSRKHDVIFYYTKDEDYIFNIDEIRVPYKETSGYAKSGIISAAGKKYMPNPLGTPVDDVWGIPIINPLSDERIGYPTQKPEKLLERIIRASSNEGDIILDPFCGRGTTVAVAQRFGRQWIGIDITYLAIDVIAKRLEKNGFRKNIDFEIDGEPKDIYSAEKLAQQDPFQFQLWCVARLDATHSATKSGDQGVDGIFNFVDYTKRSNAGKGIIQVKGTQTVNPSMVRDLKGTMMSQRADFGILITLKPPTQGMKSEALKEGYFEYRYTENSPSQLRVPKIQFLTAEDLFKDPLPIKLPPVIAPYRRPMIVEENEQDNLFKQ